MKQKIKVFSYGNDSRIDALEGFGFKIREWGGQDYGLLLATEFSQSLFTLNPQNIIMFYNQVPQPAYMGFARKVRLTITDSPGNAHRLRTRGINAISHFPYVPTNFFPRKVLPYLADICVTDTLDTATLARLTRDTHFYGNLDQASLQSIDNHKYAHYVDNINIDALPSVLSHYATFLNYSSKYIWNGIELVYASLCGLKLQVNRNKFGILSWGMDFGNASKLRKEIDNELYAFVNTINRNLWITKK